MVPLFPKLIYTYQEPKFMRRKLATMKHMLMVFVAALHKAGPWASVLHRKAVFLKG